MAANKFNTDIPDSVIADVQAKITEINDLLKPYYVDLSQDEKDHLPKIADKTLSFAEKTDGYLDSEPKFNPAYIDVTETHKDFANYKKVLPVIEKFQALEDNLININVAAGSDAFIQYLAYYSNVREADKRGIPGAKAIYEELSKRFPGRKKKSEEPPTP